MSLHTQANTMLPVDLVISQADVQINVDSVTCLDTTTNHLVGVCRGQPARFVQMRQLNSLSRAGVDVRAMLTAEATLRQAHATPNHVPVAGIHQTSPATGGGIFLVEAPYRYTNLRHELAANPSADPVLMFKQAVEIVVDLHSNGLVHGSVMEQSFAVGPSGNLSLVRFQNMRPEDPNVPFHPIGNLSVGATAFMAPELLRSLRDDGSVSLSKATDIYGLGCLGYQLLTGIDPFSKCTHTGNAATALARLIATVVDCQGFPDRPAGVSESYWSVLEGCWGYNPAGRPTAVALRQSLESWV